MNDSDRIKYEKILNEIYNDLGINFDQLRIGESIDNLQNCIDYIVSLDINSLHRSDLMNLVNSYLFLLDKYYLSNRG